MFPASRLSPAVLAYMPRRPIAGRDAQRLPPSRRSPTKRKGRV